MASNARKVCISRTPTVSEPRAALERLGFEVTVGRIGWYDTERYGAQELSELIGDASILLSSPRESLDGAMLKAHPHLQAVVSPIIGIDHIDVAAATQLGVLVCNSPAWENFAGLAEAAVGLIVALVKGLKRNEAELRGGGWYRIENRGALVAGKTLGLVGLGRVAREMARRLAPWQMRLIGYDPYVNASAAHAMGVEKVELAELLRESDVVSLHVVLTAQTRNLIAMRELKQMKREAYLVNTSRGGVVNEEDLARALTEGAIAGAALDVFAQEPLASDSPLRAADPRKLILTPHIIGHAVGVDEPGFRMVADTLKAIFAGEVPETVINREAIARWRERFCS